MIRVLLLFAMAVCLQAQTVEVIVVEIDTDSARDLQRKYEAYSSARDAYEKALEAAKAKARHGRNHCELDFTADYRYAVCRIDLHRILAPTFIGEALFGTSWSNHVIDIPALPRNPFACGR